MCVCVCVRARINGSISQPEQALHSGPPAPFITKDQCKAQKGIFVSVCFIFYVSLFFFFWSFPCVFANQELINTTLLYQHSAKLKAGNAASYLNNCFKTVKGLIDTLSIKSNLYTEGFTWHKSCASAFTLWTIIGIGGVVLVAVRCSVQTVGLFFKSGPNGKSTFSLRCLSKQKHKNTQTKQKCHAKRVVFTQRPPDEMVPKDGKQ